MESSKRGRNGLMARCDSLGGGIICQLRWNGRNGELRAELAYSLIFTRELGRFKAEIRDLRIVEALEVKPL